MTDIVDKNQFNPVPIIEVGEKVKGGLDGAVNKPIIALADRTAYLKEQLEGLLKSGVNVIGTLDTQADLDAVDTESLSKGDGYFLQGALNLWNGNEWVSSGSLVGPAGQGVDEVSGDPGNVLSFGKDGKLYATTDIPIDLLEIYTQAKE